MTKLLKDFNLQLFNEGEGEGSTEAGPANQQQAVVVYGKAPTGVDQTDNGSGTSDNPPATDEESFEDLINGKYKEAFESRVKGIVNNRLKERNEKTAKYTAMEPVMQVLAMKYGMDPSNMDYGKLAQALQQDDSLFEEAAMEKGMSTREFKLKMENDALRATQARNAQEERARATFERINREAEVVKQFYPNFDLNAEMQNPDFGRLMSAGVNVRTAYEVVHRNEINGQLIQYGAQKASEQVAKSVQANQARPQENGAGSAPAVVYKSDPSKLTREDRKAIREAARRGEKISF